uniref:F-box associated beta-propeller type 3 domain-containing protein n=1 Tax=Oryza barthii TaxID=65489 RepID=A0A0D3FIV8_9ORYZ
MPEAKRSSDSKSSLSNRRKEGEEESKASTGPERTCARLSELASAEAMRVAIHRVRALACTTVLAPETRGIVFCGYAHPTTSRYHLLHADDAYPYNHTAAAATVRILRVGDDNNAWRRIVIRHPAGVESRNYIRFGGAPPVILHGCLHWLVDSLSARPLLSVFDMEREEFRLMDAPEQWARHANPLDIKSVQIARRSGKLCAFVNEPSACALGMWTLEDYSDPSSWRLERRIDYSRHGAGSRNVARTFRNKFSAATTAVEVLPDGVDGGGDGEEEIMFQFFNQFDMREAVYNVGHGAWRWRRILPPTRRVMTHKECMLPREVSFGGAAHFVEESRRGRRWPRRGLDRTTCSTRSSSACRRVPSSGAVCKAWRSRTSHPYFLRAHAARSRKIAAAVVYTAAFPLAQFRTTVSIRPLSDSDGDNDGDSSGAADPPRVVSSSSSATMWFVTCPFVLRSWDGVVCLVPRPSASFACTTVLAPETRGIVFCGYAHPTTSRYHLLHADDVYPYHHTAAATIRILQVGDNNAWRKIVISHPTGVESRSCIRFPGAPPVSLHGCLHWLVASSSSASASARPLLSVFDMEREEFRLMDAPEQWACHANPPSHMVSVQIARCSGKLCAFVNEPSASALGMWMLEDYSDPSSWWLERRIDYSRHGAGSLNVARTFRNQFSATTTAVEVLPDGVNDRDGGGGGEEIMFLFKKFYMREAVYNVGRAAWRWRRILPTTRRVMAHKECVLSREVNFGGAAHFVEESDIGGHRCFCI